MKYFVEEFLEDASFENNDLPEDSDLYNLLEYCLFSKASHYNSFSLTADKWLQLSMNNKHILSLEN